MGAPMHAPNAPKRAPVRQPAPRSRPDLHVVERPRRRLRPGPTVVLSGLLAFGIAFALVVAQALLVQGQQRLDDLSARTAEATREQQELRLQVAELESPARIVEAATTDLGMVPPEGVTYLTPSGAVTVPEAPEP